MPVIICVRVGLLCMHSYVCIITYITHAYMNAQVPAARHICTDTYIHAPKTSTHVHTGRISALSARIRLLKVCADADREQPLT